MMARHSAPARVAAMMSTMKITARMIMTTIMIMMTTTIMDLDRTMIMTTDRMMIMIMAPARTVTDRYGYSHIPAISGGIAW